MWEPDLHPLQQRLRALANPEQALQLQRFFKTAPGEYGAGDRFLGIKVPPQRALAKAFCNTPLPELVPLLRSPWHEERLTGFLVLLLQYQRARTDAARQRVLDLLLAERAGLNNWDLVDVIVPGTLGDWLVRHPEARAWLGDWVQDESLWERRMAVMASFALIRAGEYAPTLWLCEQTLASVQPVHDLIQKALGWMLREIGKRDLPVLLDFLDRQAARLPRTLLRYALEKLPESQRQLYLRAKAIRQSELS